MEQERPGGEVMRESRTHRLTRQMETVGGIFGEDNQPWPTNLITEAKFLPKQLLPQLPFVLTCANLSCRIELRNYDQREDNTPLSNSTLLFLSSLKYMSSFEVDQFQSYHSYCRLTILIHYEVPGCFSREKIYL